MGAPVNADVWRARIAVRARLSVHGYGRRWHSLRTAWECGAPWKFSGDATGYRDYDTRSGFAIVEVAVDYGRVRVEFLDVDGRVFDDYMVPSQAELSSDVHTGEFAVKLQ